MTKHPKPKHLDSGEWWEAGKLNKTGNEFTLVCCDCALHHNVKMRIRDGKVEFRFVRLGVSTALARRNFPVVKKKHLKSG